MSDTIISAILIIVILMTYALWFNAMISVGTIKKGKFIWVYFTVALLIGFLLIAYLINNIKNIIPADWAQIILTLGLVAVTSIYAWSTDKMAKATKVQAEASVRMAEEMKEQRIMASRPIIIPKAIHKSQTDIRTFGSKEYFMRFEIFNEGNGPAIELEMYLLDNNKNMIEKISETILRANEVPIKLLPSNLESLVEHETYYFMCQYQGIFSRDTWYQTWFPFEPGKSSEKDKIYIKPLELIFKIVDKKESY